MIGCFFKSSDWCISILAVHSVICSLGGPLPHGSPVVRVKSYVNSLFDPVRVVIRVTIHKLYFVPEWLVSGVVGMF